jgi:toxin secretion/phage lysis holin
MDIVKMLATAMFHNKIIELVVIAVVMDTVFGAARAVKHRSFNSSMGIDGAIRKISMLISLVFLSLIDYIVDINLIGFIPEGVRSYLPEGMAVVGLAAFFGLLYLCYEIVSILKNMTLCGLPVKGLWEAVRKFLGAYTEELPDSEELEENKVPSITATVTDNVPEGALDVNPDGTVNVYDEEGNVVGYITKEKAEELAAQVEKVETE